MLLGVIGGFITAPIHALCLFAVWVSSGKPIYFVQERAGLDGKPFKLIKFRTMKVGTHEVDGGYPTQDMVTSVGRVLRSTSLDEIPQILNIIKGDMSVVGPRPALMEQVSRYTEKQRRRLSVRPGLTGLAQVRYRNAATWSVRIESDLEYVDNISLLNDLKLILMTIPAQLTGKGIETGQTQQQVDDLGMDA